MSEGRIVKKLNEANLKRLSLDELSDLYASRSVSLRFRQLVKKRIDRWKP